MLEEEIGKGVTSSYVTLFEQYWTYYEMKNDVDLYGKKFQEGGQFYLDANACKTFETGSDRAWHVDEDQRVAFILFYHLKT